MYSNPVISHRDFYYVSINRYCKSLVQWKIKFSQRERRIKHARQHDWQYQYCGTYFFHFLPPKIIINKIDGLLPLDHPPRHLQQLMRGAESPFTHFAEHLRKLKQTWFPIQALDARQGAIALNQLLHLIVFIAKRRELREMCHAEDLMCAREVP